MCHLIGSDAHDSNKRNFCLADARTEIENFANNCSVLFHENPFNIINGNPINTEGILIKEKSLLNKIIGNFYTS